MAAATVGLVALDPERGRQATERPAADPGRGRELLGLGGATGASRNVIAGRVASPRASTATSVGPWPSTPIATISATSVARSARTAPTTADHQAPGSCSAQPCPPPTSSA